MGQIEDLSAGYLKAPHPLVFHIFGKASSTPDYAVTDDDLFYSRRKTILYKKGDAVAFTAELYDNWVDRFGKSAPESCDSVTASTYEEEIFPVDGIFISYASEDRQRIKPLTASLAARSC